MKLALHFATKLNSWDIKKCNCFWVPSSARLCSARLVNYLQGKGPRNYNVQPWLVGWGGGGWGGEAVCHKNVQQSFLNQNLPPSLPHLPLKIPGSVPGLSSLEMRLSSLKRYCKFLRGLSNYDITNAEQLLRLVNSLHQRWHIIWWIKFTLFAKFSMHTTQRRKILQLSGCKENDFYSLPFGQAEASSY